MITFSIPSLCRVMLAATALTMTVSCLPGSMPFDSGGPFGAATGDGIGQRSAVPTVARSSSIGFFGGGGGGYSDRGYGRGYGYGSRSVCNVCGYNPCRCSSRSSSHAGHGHDDHRSSPFSTSSSRRSSSSSHDDHKAEHPHAHDTYKVTSSSGLRPGQTKPTGYHSNDWYKSRGYDTSKLNLKNEHGEKKGSSSSNSKSKSSSSSSSKKRKD